MCHSGTNTVGNSIASETFSVDATAIIQIMAMTDLDSSDCVRRLHIAR